MEFGRVRGSGDVVIGGHGVWRFGFSARVGLSWWRISPCCGRWWSAVGYAAAVVICVRLGFGCLVWAQPFRVGASLLCFELYFHIWAVRPFILIVMSDLGILGS